MNIVDSFSLKGKVALVTGGAGLYGRQIVEALLQAGAKTYCASRNMENLKKFADEMAQKGYDLSVKHLDLADEGSILNLRDEMSAAEGRTDILVNNAVLRPVKSWDDGPEKFDESMKVNATGLFVITRAFGELMIKNMSGSIINIGSIYGMVGTEPSMYEGLGLNGFVPDYYFHKGGMVNFTKIAASYYGRYNIRCNCISPGGFWVESQNKLFVERYSSRTFLGRMANSTDLMGIIVFLSSDASEYITGTNIPVDGGYTSK